MPQGITHVVHRFGKLKIQIEEAILRDPRFRSLCEDYGEAVNALNFWLQSPDARAATMIIDYKQLLVELEREILAELQQRPEEPLRGQ